MLLLEPYVSKLVNYSRHRRMLWYRKIVFFKENVTVSYFCQCNVQRLTLPRKIDQFGRKRCQKKRKDVGYKLIQEFFSKKNFCTWTVSKIRSLHTYVMHRMFYFERYCRFIFMRGIVNTSLFCKSPFLFSLLPQIWDETSSSISNNFFCAHNGFTAGLDYSLTFYTFLSFSLRPFLFKWVITVWFGGW